MSRPAATPGARMNYLIKGRQETGREELVAHWFANHMPAVIKGQETAAAKGRMHASRYIATLYDADRDGNRPWDGVAQLWWEQPLPRPDQPHGTEPTDSFQERAETYIPWATTEYVVIDGSDRLPVNPLTLNPPFPTTRSGFHKVTSLVAAQEGVDYEAFYAHWLDVHVPNVKSVMEKVGGWRYVVAQSVDPANEQYAGMAELYFDDASGWKEFVSAFEPDGLEQWTAPANGAFLTSTTEMVGIP